ncbi:hypothetical protein NN561_002735 [Cricetulus griseus]
MPDSGASSSAGGGPVDRHPKLVHSEPCTGSWRTTFDSGAAAYGPPEDPPNLQPLQYWPFSSADLYNWKTNHPSFSENPTSLMGLMESLMFSHQPTWDDCQQLLQVLFTTEEKERILLEARKNVPGANGALSNLPNEIDAGFPLTGLIGTSTQRQVGSG